MQQWHSCLGPTTPLSPQAPSPSRLLGLGRERLRFRRHPPGGPGSRSTGDPEALYNAVFAWCCTPTSGAAESAASNRGSRRRCRRAAGGCWTSTTSPTNSTAGADPETIAVARDSLACKLCGRLTSAAVEIRAGPAATVARSPSPAMGSDRRAGGSFRQNDHVAAGTRVDPDSHSGETRWPKTADGEDPAARGLEWAVSISPAEPAGPVLLPRDSSGEKRIGRWRVSLIVSRALFAARVARGQAGCCGVSSSTPASTVSQGNGLGRPARRSSSSWAYRPTSWTVVNTLRCRPHRPRGERSGRGRSCAASGRSRG